MTVPRIVWVRPSRAAGLFELYDAAADTVAVIAAPDVLPELQRRKRAEPATRIYASQAVRQAAGIPEELL